MRKLAQGFAPEKRNTSEQGLREMLADFERINKRLGLPVGDAGVATASLVAASVAVLTGKPTTVETLKATARQFQLQLGADPGFRKSSAAARRTVYERNAILAVVLDLQFVDLRKTGDDAARRKAQQVARHMLKSVVGVAPERVRVDSRGMTILPV